MNCKKKSRAEIGNQIYEAINKSGKTHEYIAELLNLSTPRVIYCWCNGEKLPRLERYIELLDILAS